MTVEEENQEEQNQIELEPEITHDVEVENHETTDINTLEKENLNIRKGEYKDQINELESLEKSGKISKEQRAELIYIRKLNDDEPVKKHTSRKWWDDLYHSKLKAQDCIYELVDNSIGHMQVNAGEPMKLNVEITITESARDSQIAEKIEIKDNAKGISKDELGAVLSMWGKTGEHDDENISEHGCGMKYGIRGLGKKVKIITKTKESPLALVIDTEDILSMDTNGFHPKIQRVDFEHGTHIIITELESQGENLARTKYQKQIDLVRSDLGCRYQRILTSKFNTEDDNGGLRIIRKLSNGNPDVVDKVKSLKPVYFCTRDNAPNYSLKVILEDPRGEWKATVYAGEYPDYDDDMNEMSAAWKMIQDAQGKNFVNERRVKSKDGYHPEPYKRTSSNSGFDIIRRGIVVERGFLSGESPYRIGEIDQWNNDYNPLIGQIIIEKGFSTGTQKIGITRDRHFEELCSMLTPVLYGEADFVKIDGNTHRQNFLGKTIRGTSAKHKTEEELEAGIVAMLKKPDAQRITTDKGEVFPKFDTDDIFRQVWSGPGRADIIVNEASKKYDTVVIEVKKGDAIGQDAYQLLMYMHDHNTNYGILAAEGKRDGFEKACSNILSNHSKIPFLGKKKPIIHFYNLTTHPVDIPSDLSQYTKKKKNIENPDSLVNGKPINK
jgi:hypothetical protein